MERKSKEFNLDQKYNRLKDILKSLQSVVIAFSGGVDSSFLISVAYEVLGEKALAVTAESSLYPQHEVEEAKNIASKIGIPHETFFSEELTIPEFSKNPPLRCYYCKKELFSKLWGIARKKKFKHVVDGANHEDLNDYRPGIKAGQEWKVVSPLVRAQLNKHEIRELSKKRGLPTWSKPSLACLASRFPYGTNLTPEKLSQVEKAEQFLREMGLKQLRVRHHGEIARIEVAPQEISLFFSSSRKEKIVKKFIQLGFTYVTLDLKGYRTGSMNEIL